MKKLHALLLLVILFAVSFPQLASAAVIDEVKQYVQDYYVGELDGNLQNAKTIDEVIDLLDPYSTYMTKEEYDSFVDAVDMSAVGIGVVVEKHEKGIMIMQVIENGSAFKAGILEGDIITSINGQDAAPMSIQEATSKIKGKSGTTVTLQILKPNGKTNSLTIARKPFSIPNTSSELLYGKVGYIALSSFSTDAASLVAKDYQQLKNQGATSYILDLRNNGGGYVEAAEELIGMFPNAPYAYDIKYTNTLKREYNIFSTLTKAVQQRTKFPANTRVLINGQSASASEMTAAALIDQKAAILYGQTTYGKGSMQTFFDLSNGDYLKLTIGIFKGPKGLPINKVGVTPTIETTTDAIFTAHYDSITEKLDNYKKLKALSNVPTTKVFSLAFDKKISPTVAKDAIELVALGGDKVETTIQVKGKTIIIKPRQPLVAGGEYMLIVHPKVKDTSSKIMKVSSYRHLTIAEN